MQARLAAALKGRWNRLPAYRRGSEPFATTNAASWTETSAAGFAGYQKVCAQAVAVDASPSGSARVSQGSVRC